MKRAPASAAPSWRWITQIAFSLALAIVIARFATEEIMRDPWDVVPGGQPIPRAAGPATGVVLDLLSLVPGLLALLRAVIDPTFRIVHRWSFVPLFALGAWAACSVGWSADKFSAAVAASHFLAAICLLWAAAQLVRTWLHLRVAAAIGFGLLLVLAAQSIVFRLIDIPDDVRYFQENKPAILKAHGWEAGSFAAEQFELKLKGGELAGFFVSPNTFAAVGVMLLMISVGIGIQKTLENRQWEWLWICLVAAVAAGWIIVEARSKAAGATPVLGALLLAGVAVFRPRMRRRPTFFYWIGVAAVVLCIIAVVGHGLYHGGLFPGHFSNSLDFRWKYWVASFGLFREHPWLGVGWNNFGWSYLSVRLPAASEEIKDPHNFLVRFFVELGAVGGTLAVLWLMRGWWETTRPGENILASNAEAEKPVALGYAARIVLLGIILGVIANVDFAQMLAVFALELLRWLLYLMVLLLGTLAAAMLSPHETRLDDRAAPWIIFGLLTALGLMWIHNLIDFSMFEPGVMIIFFFAIGAALGVAPAKRFSSRPVAGALLAIGLAGAATAAIVFAAPIIAGEQSAFEADQAIRIASKDDPRPQYLVAANLLSDALQQVPYNSDYALRDANAWLGAGNPRRGQAMIAEAIRLNPLMIDAYLLQANWELHSPRPSATIVRTDFETILKLNPNDVSLHTQNAQALEKLGDPAEAAVQLQKALDCDSALPVGEPKRMTPQQIADVKREIQRDRGL